MGLGLTVHFNGVGVNSAFYWVGVNSGMPLKGAVRGSTARDDALEALPPLSQQLS